jgi:hypothetical protein
LKDVTQGKPLVEKVRDWLQSEGYPLEFRTAHAFRAEGFYPRQGVYVRETKTSPPREIDVLAELKFESEHKVDFQINLVVECKWTRDKPWVVFTTPETRMPASACIGLTLSSLLADAIMYCLASNAALYSLDLFKAGERSGFGGRAALGAEKDDRFYAAVQSIITKGVGLC